MLQLANSGNIEIVADKTWTGHDNISCKLLSGRLREDAFDEYDFTGEKTDLAGSANLRQESREEPSDNENDDEEVILKKKSAAKAKRAKKPTASKSKKSRGKKTDQADKENIFNGARPLEVSEY